MTNQEAWTRANQELIAKSIGELTFEEILLPIKKQTDYTLTLKSGVTYSFTGKMSIWTHLKVDPASIKRNNSEAHDAAQFFLDTQEETGMTDIIMGNFFEEMHNTLYSDMEILFKRKSLTVSNLADWDSDKIQTILNGHPKILLNKGRMGWGASDLKTYSPETSESFQLHWLAVKKTLLSGEAPLEESFNEKDKLVFFNVLNKKGVSLTDYSLLPVHPWQWDQIIKIQFASSLAQGSLIDLGVGGDFYLPQISIRTLSNVSRPSKMDIKLPLTILNTSSIRGIPAKTISLGVEISTVLGKLCQEDSFLNKMGLEILSESQALALIHPAFSKIKEAPYRYHEYLGAIWRDSSESKLKENQKAVITGALFFQDDEKNSLIGEFIKRSGLSQKEWLASYFRVVVLPLYHLQLQYGVGLVAHGQNIILKMENFRPIGMIIKDFQGDLRLSNELPLDGKKHFSHLKDRMTKLPPHYLIHDLITGHFITVLRFISEVMEENDSFKEEDFYRTLHDVIHEYTLSKKIDERQNLLAPTLQRVLLNKVRFAIGYSDSAVRPLPMVGSELKNPMAFTGKS